MERKVLKICTVVIVAALVLRLLGAANWNITIPTRAAAWLIFLQTGRTVRPGNLSATSPTPTEPDAPTNPPETTTIPTDPVSPPEPSQPMIPTFSPEDAAAITVSSNYTWQADLPKLLSQPLSWDLTGDAPTVLIVHSHGTESFTGGDYIEASPYHTLDPAHNMLCVGEYLATLLRARGISVIHDTTIHDYPSYSLAYNNSRQSIQTILAENPSIRLVLDLHRDAYEDANGNQGAHTVFSQGSELAQLMLVVGSDYDGWTHPNWQENLSIALKLQSQLEEICPGICRSLSLRSQRFNQDLSTGSLLIEVGSSGNSLIQAIRATEMLAQAILSLAHGSQ